jgi:hypothetical protein
MKTTLEIADATFRKAKVVAAENGISLKDFFNEALEEKLRKKTSEKKESPAWLKLEGVFGKTAADRAETRRIQKVIDEEFEVIEPEDHR